MVFPQDAAALLEAPYARRLWGQSLFAFCGRGINAYIEANYAVRKDKAGRFMVGSAWAV